MCGKCQCIVKSMSPLYPCFFCPVIFVPGLVFSEYFLTLDGQDSNHGVVITLFKAPTANSFYVSLLVY